MGCCHSLYHFPGQKVSRGWDLRRVGITGLQKFFLSLGTVSLDAKEKDKESVV